MNRNQIISQKWPIAAVGLDIPASKSIGRGGDRAHGRKGDIMENIKEFVGFTVAWIVILCVLALAAGKFVSGFASDMQGRIANATARMK